MADLDANSEARFESEAVAYPPAWRTGAALLRIVARGSLLLTAASYFVLENPPSNPLRQMRLFLAFFAVPEAAAWLIARAYAAKVVVLDGALRIEQREQSTEIPVGGIAQILPWRFPLPYVGVGLKLKSGRRFGQGLALRDPDGLARALAAEGAPGEIRDLPAQTMVAYMRSRLANPRSFLENPFLKFVIYSLVPALPAFRLHQFITFGGTFGEYYTFGLKAYLLALGIWWASWAIYLVLFASVLRSLVELITLLAAATVPAAAPTVRRFAEWVQRLLFYAGLPTFIALRLLA